jgi:hypothetical protein
MTDPTQAQDETDTPTRRKLRAVEDKMEAMRPAVIERVQAAIDKACAASGKPMPKRLAGAPFEIVEPIIAQRDAEYGALASEAHDLNLKWNIEMGWY